MTKFAMVISNYPCPTADAARFVANDVGADARAACGVRDEFAGWLRRQVDVDLTRFSDIVLAVNEALANAAEFAYAQSGGVGTFDVEAVHDSAGAALTVTISDQGRWRDQDPTVERRTRGRGIPLMRMLAEQVTIDRSPLGTTVFLRFDNVDSRSSVGNTVRQ